MIVNRGGSKTNPLVQAVGKSLSLNQISCSIPWKHAMLYQGADFLISGSILSPSFTICPF